MHSLPSLCPGPLSFTARWWRIWGGTTRSWTTTRTWTTGGSWASWTAVWWTVIGDHFQIVIDKKKTAGTAFIVTSSVSSVAASDNSSAYHKSLHFVWELL